MSRLDIFSFRVSSNERHLIADLAEKLQRTQSDAVRFVVINAALELKKQVSPAPTSLEAQTQGISDVGK